MFKFSPFQWSSFNFFGFYCAYGVFLPFFPIWLKHHGYDTDVIGTFVALGYLFRFSGAMFFSKRVSHPNQLINLNRFLTWATVVILLVMAWAVDSIWLLLPVLMLFHIFNGGAMPIGDTIASTWQQQIGLDYGRTRLFGSLAFVIGVISTGYIVDWFGESVIIGILMGWVVFLGLGLMVNPTRYFDEKAKNKSQDDLSYGQLLKNSTTLRMLIVASLIQASHAAYYAYSTIYWTEQGISTQNVSLLWGLAVSAEICFFFFSNRLFKAWKISHLVILSVIACVVRWALLATATNAIALGFIQILHALTYGVGHYAMIRYIAMQPTEQMPKLQALYFGSSNCALMALFTFVAGFSYQTSPALSFGLMMVFVIPAFLIIPKKFEVKL
ncbi:3-phenylpropionic acid transporter [Pasteurellaceae bacterium 15-036681]|nr:3-phenylpropionic acid transporter [Pasteurellaceae bacterium 15-036681]